MKVRELVKQLLDCDLDDEIVIGLGESPGREGRAHDVHGGGLIALIDGIADHRGDFWVRIVPDAVLSDCLTHQPHPDGVAHANDS